MAIENQFPSLENESREFIPTACAAHHLMRRPQTLRIAHCRGTLPVGLRPKILGGRLAWSVEAIRAYLADGAK
jgi:hypothetical protein